MDLDSHIASGPPRRGEAADWYRQLLELAEHDGLTAASLASRLGRSTETVYAWRRRLAQAPTAPRQVQVSVASPARPASAHPLEVKLREGRSVLVPPAFDPDSLAAVVAVLERC